MPDILYARDCILYYYGDSRTVKVSDDLVSGGWPGGQGVQWAPSDTDEPTVTYSQGLWGGFLLWGSDEAADQYTAMTRQYLVYRYGVLFCGGCLIGTSSYERYTYASRVGPGPLVPLVYGANDPLYLSRRGLWTKEDEMTLAADPQAPAQAAAFVAQVPKVSNHFFLHFQTVM